MDTESSTFVPFLPSQRTKLSYVHDNTDFPPVEIFQITQCLDFNENIKPANITDETLKISETVKIDYGKGIEPNEEVYIEVDPNIPELKEVIDLPIEASILENLCFKEDLLISLRTTRVREPSKIKMNKHEHELLDIEQYTEVGGMCILISQGDNDIHISVASEFSHFKKGAVLTISAKTNPSLNLIMERRVETLCDGRIKTEKILEVTDWMGGLYGIRADYTEGIYSKFNTTIHMDCTGTFMLDGIGFLLMRYLALQKFIGVIETYSMYVTGEMCRSTYTCTEKRHVVVNGYVCNVMKIKRTILRHNAPPDESVSIYMETGHLIRHTWKDCPYVVHINPVSPLPPRNFHLDIDDSWQNDVELLTKYFCLKEERMKELKNVVHGTSPIKSCIQNYIMCLLHTKPQYVLEYTRKYFEKIDANCEALISEFIKKNDVLNEEQRSSQKSHQLSGDSKMTDDLINFSDSLRENISNSNQ